MPITQATMIELMRESRAALQYGAELRHSLLEYLAFTRTRYPNNPELQEVLTALEYTIKTKPQPTDRATYRNEYHYRKVSKNNDRQRVRQEQQRRAGGIPTQEEALARLHEMNMLKRAGGVQSYEQFNRGIEPQVSQRSKPAKGIKIPDDSNEPPLEFDTIETLPAMPQNVKGEIVKSGLDIALPDDTIGQPDTIDKGDRE